VFKLDKDPSGLLGGFKLLLGFRQRAIEEAFQSLVPSHSTT